MLRGLEPPEPPLGDGVVSLLLSDATRDVSSPSVSDDPEIRRSILGGAAPHRSQAIRPSGLALRASCSVWSTRSALPCGNVA